MTAARIIRGKGYGLALAGAIQGAVPCGITLGLVGAAVERIIPHAFAIGVGVGLWLGAAFGALFRLRWAGQKDAERTAVIVAVIAVVSVGAMRFAYVRGFRGPLLWLEGGASLDSMQVAFAMLVVSLPALAVSALGARFVARRHRAA